MKDCLIIGFPTALHYNDVYPLLKDKILTVTERAIHFNPEAEDVRCNWFTTLSRSVDMSRRRIYKTYNPQDYQRYDNYDAVECKYKNDIPVDYEGKIGVPDSFWFYYPELDYEVLEHRGDLKLNGKTVYERLIIRRKKL